MFDEFSAYYPFISNYYTTKSKNLNLGLEDIGGIKENNVGNDLEKNNSKTKLALSDSGLTRISLLTYLEVQLAWRTLKKTSKPIYEIPQVTRDLIRYHNTHKNSKNNDGISILYVPLHKSFWETLMLPCVITQVLGGDLPYIIMNTKRVKKGTIARFLLDNSGILGIDRTSRDAGLRALELTEKVLGNNKSLMYYAEGTRTQTGKVGKFGVSGFQAAINASKISPVFIVPIDVAYSYVHEVMVTNKKNYGLKDTFASMNDTYGNVYISFGTPMRVNNTGNVNNKLYREELTRNVHDACIDLKLILPENIHAEAIRRINPTKESIIDKSELLAAISSVVDDLSPYHNRFRRITDDVETSLTDLIDPKKSNLNLTISNNILKNSTLPTDSNLMDKYIVYSNYIEPFLPNYSH